MNNFNLSDLPTPQLKAIRQILVAGAPSKAEKEDLTSVSQLCHKSPPKGYPKEKSSYGDPACFRYPLNTKAKALAAWRYVHQASNKQILGTKFKSIESKIKSYAKKNYGLDLQVGESEDFDWEQAFCEYYDAETMGERCEPTEIELEDEEASLSEVKNMDNDEKITTLEAENKALKEERDTLTTEKTGLEEKASQVDTLTQELKDQREELETLRQFKKTSEEAAERAGKLKTIKEQLTEAGIEANLEDEATANYWLGKSEEDLKTTIALLSESKKDSKASAGIKVPQITDPEVDDPVETVRKGLKDKKEGK